MRRFALLMAAIAISTCAVGINAASAVALSPAVETSPASSIAEKGATLRGLVNPNGGETKAYFEYGTTTSYGSKTAEVNVGSGTTTLETSQAISGLSANTVYHYRILATNPSGSSQGVDGTFTTVGAPAVSGLSATPEFKTGESATLKASVDPNGQSTTYQFEYGVKSGSYTNVVPIPAESAGSGYEPTSVDINVTGLTPGTTYFWRVSATNASGKVSSSEPSFLSSFHPSFEVLPASEVTRTGATLSANEKWASKYWFEYGTTTSYGTKTTVKEIGGTEGLASQPISGLKANTVYHYRFVAENGAGTHASSDFTFTTLSAATLYLKGGGEPIKTSSSLKAFSTSLSFTGESAHSCNEAEFAGIVLENPGALQGVATTKIQNSGAKCPWKSGYTIAYSIPTPGITIDYAKNGAGEGFARTSKFTLVQTPYLESFKLAECKYSLTLIGTFKTFVALEASLAGKTEVVEGSPYCPGAESVSGKFVVTSGGTAVEAK
jgi:hypothetical protein